MDKAKYQSIFAQIKAEHAVSKPVSRTKDSEILVIDGFNIFIRSWTVVPTLSENGEHIGGITGFLLSLGYAVKLLRPTRIVVVFDGKGGSLRRKQLYPEYKANRAMGIKVNRTYAEMSDPKTEQEEMIRQMQKLIELLRNLPVSIVCIDHIEADDAIAYIANNRKEGSNVTIMSGDKDFLQLVNKNVTVYSPTKKKIYGVQDVVDEFGIHPSNFVYFRCLDGDTSDNIDGIKGFGLKTTRKLFPMLTDEKRVELTDILKYAEDRRNEKVAFQSVTENADIFKRNYKLMQLNEADFSLSLQMLIESSTGKINEYNKFELIQQMTKYGMHNSIQNFHVWLQEVFWPLSVLAKTTTI